MLRKPAGVLRKPAGLCMKRPYGAIMPKKGKLRALTRPPQRRPKVPYVQKNEKPRKETKWCVNLKFFMTASDVQILEKLKEYGWLRMHKRCPRCNANLTSSRLRRNCQYHSRCPSRGCQMRVTWTHGHPLLQSGPASLDLRMQASIFLGIALGCTQHALSIQLGLSRSTIQWYVDKLKQYICKVVKKEQDMIAYGTSTDDWDEVEVDEVTLSKVKVGQKHRWSNFIGLIKRGSPGSLWISRLPDRLTTLKAPGPGPIQSKVWREIAKSKIDNKGIILHSDSARAHLRTYRRMTHTRVVHCKKWKNGKWTKPFFSKHEKVQCGRR